MSDHNLVIGWRKSRRSDSGACVEVALAAGPEQPDRAGESSRSGQVSTSGPAPVSGGDRAVQGRTQLPPGATTPGPCPHCGHHGPRIVLCHNPVCLHSETSHVIRKGKPRGACGASSGPKGTACPCDQFIPNPETPQ